MRQVGLLALTLICAALAVLVTAWPDIREWRGAGNWRVARVEADRGTLDGVSVRVDAARAVILPSLPDRALVYLRLEVQGDEDRLRGWLMCDLGLTDAQGRKWLPLTGEIAAQIGKLLGDPGDPHRGCSQTLSGGEALSVQAFMLPVEALNDLRAEISGASTRPDALSLPFRPVLRPPPS